MDYYSEFERIAARGDVNGCGGDCVNCDCSSVCSYARTDEDDCEDDGGAV